MKVAVQCESPLLQRSLELFLDGHLTSLKHSDIVIRDHPVDDERIALLIGTGDAVDLVKPFSRSQLYIALEKRLHGEKETEHIQQITAELNAQERVEDLEDTDEQIRYSGENLDFSILEKRIEKLTKEYQQNVMQAIRTFYEN